MKGVATQQAAIKVKTEIVDPDDCHPRYSPSRIPATVS
jgi:hypothetical protein